MLASAQNATALPCGERMRRSNRFDFVTVQLILLTVMTIVMDILWIFVMREVWSGKPLKNANAWKAFENIRSITLLLSFVNLVLKAIAIVFLIPIMRGGRVQQPLAGASHM